MLSLTNYKKILRYNFVGSEQEPKSFLWLAVANLVLNAVKTVYGKDGVTPIILKTVMQFKY